jgi:membrane protein
MAHVTSARVPAPLGLRPWSRLGLRLLIVSTAREFWKDRVLGLSAEAAFWQLLSLPPLLLAVMGTIGFFGGLLGPDTVADVQRAILDAAGRVLAPNAVQNVVKPAVQAILSGGRLDVVSVGFALSLWSGSTAMSTYVNTITIAYDLRECRSAVRSRLLALALYLGAVVAGVVLLPALVLGPTLLVRLAPGSWRGQVSTAVNASYWPVVVLGSIGLLATLYHLAVPIRTRWLRALPGSVLALVIWLLGSVGLRWYVGRVIRASSAYSSLSAPIALLLFLYLTALAVLIGAELNAEIDKLWPSPATAAARARGRFARLSSGARRWVPSLRE